MQVLGPRREQCPEAHSLGGSAPQTPRYQSAFGLPIYILAPDVRMGPVDRTILR